MAAIMVAVGAVGLAAWLTALLLLRHRPHRSAVLPSAGPVSPSREEDRVRPALTPSGERIWIDGDELDWHEIVAWPQLKKTGQTGVRRSA